MDAEEIRQGLREAVAAKGGAEARILTLLEAAQASPEVSMEEAAGLIGVKRTRVYEMLREGARRGGTSRG